MILLGITLWFWIECLLGIVLLTTCIEKEWPGWSTFIFIIFCISLWWPFDLGVWEWVYAHPGTILKYFIIYIVIGMAWVFGRYYFKLRKIRAEIAEAKIIWDSDREQGHQTTYNSFSHYVKSNFYEYKFEKTISHAVLWGAYWPLSFIWNIINHPVKRFFTFLFMDLFKGTFKKMHQKMVGDMWD